MKRKNEVERMSKMKVIEEEKERRKKKKIEKKKNNGSKDNISYKNTKDAERKEKLRK